MSGKWILVMLLMALVGGVSFFVGDLWLDLKDTQEQLSTTQEQLTDTVLELNTTKSELSDTEVLLDVSQQQLDNTEAELNATETELNTTKAQLRTTESQLATKSNQLETIQNTNTQMLNQYDSLRSQINVRFGDTTQDIQSFITPENPLVDEKVQQIAGSFSSDVNEYWRDFERLYRWVVNNITYSYDSYVPRLPATMSGELSWRGECWRTPEETFEDETGDCEDMALLLASMLLNYEEGRYDNWLICISSPDGAHVAVAFPVEGNELTILDPAGNYYTGWQYGTLSSDSISTAVNNWLSYWSSDMPDAEVVQVFSEDIDEHFDSTDEFISWAME